MDTFTSTTLSGLIGTLIGALVAYVLASKAQKINFTFDFHREFNSLEMCAHRNSAEKVASAYPRLDYNQLGAITNPGVDSLNLVMRFYERLWLAVEHRQVKSALICEMFADIFFYWYYVSFKDNFIKLDWSATAHIESLAKWFCEEIDVDRHTHLRRKYEALRAKWLSDTE